MYKVLIAVTLMMSCAGLGTLHAQIVKDEFTFDKAPYPECHAATIAETPNGLVAAWFGGTKERNPDVCIWVSRRVNGQWTEGVNVANGIQNPTLRYACWNPVLYQAGNGELLLFYKVGPSPAKWKGWMLRSKDGGITWSAPEALPEGFLGPIKDKPVLLSDGSLLCPSSTEDNGSKVHFERTADWGKTWQMMAPVAAGADKPFKAIQPTILFHKDGSLQALCRSQDRAILETWSHDNGKTWSALSPTSLPNNNSGIDGVTLKDGRQLLVYNHVLPPKGQSKGARSPLNVAVSPDGKTWYAALVLEQDTLGQYSYPSVIQSADGMVQIVYTWRRKRIKYVEIDPSKLVLTKIVDGVWPAAPVSVATNADAVAGAAAVGGDAVAGAAAVGGDAVAGAAPTGVAVGGGSAGGDELQRTSAGPETSDGAYAKPLKEVLQDIEKQFHVRIKFTDSMVVGKVVPFARWRFRDDVETTLAGVLEPLDMKVNKVKDSVYKLKDYEYYRWSVEDGKKLLDDLASKYSDAAAWEQRKARLRQDLYKALELSPLPPAPASKPILTPIRKMDGYTIQNISIETLPGLYVSGSIYRPEKIRGKIPVILCPDGHFDHGRYRPDCQYRCATLARLGCAAISYDLFAWGESQLQFKYEDHRRSLAQSIQALDAIRILDYMLTLKEADTSRVGISGGSGGGNQTTLVTALDDRIKLSAPVVSVSCYMFGGCPCESGMPIYESAGGTDIPEIAAMAAPRPLLVVSDGGDWTDHVPQIEYPYLKTVYGYLGKQDLVQNVHLPNEVHDFGINKRIALYRFIAQQFRLDIHAIEDKDGKIDESKVTIEDEPAMYAFGKNGENLPADAIKGFDAMTRVFAAATAPGAASASAEASTRGTSSAPGAARFDAMSIRVAPDRPAHPAVRQGAAPPRYQVAVVDLMLLKRQKPGALTLAKTVGADGIELDMGGLGDRETFDNKLVNDTVRQQFLDMSRDLNIKIASLAMTGFYAQSFATRPTAVRAVGDCIHTMRLMGVKVGFLPLGVQGDLVKNPELRPAIVERLKEVGRMARDSGVVIAIETSLSAKEEVKLLKDIGSPAIKICFNFADPLEEGLDLYRELETLGARRIAEIHCTNKDGVWLQNDPQIDLKKVRQLLDKMKWSGWLVIERSRDAKDPKNVKKNFSANTAYVKSIFE
jgi:predicted neuraminidase/sugar phosphate isomerase/epimerase